MGRRRESIEENIIPATPLGVILMASTRAKQPPHGRAPPKGRPIAEVGMTPAEARGLPARLTSFARDWDDPRMDVCDNQP